MKLRYLEKKDASYMLEWMHDEDVVENLQADFMSKTIDDCEGFINNSINDSNNLQLAVVDDKDEYMGTVSLKHIDEMKKTAEFAIVVRSCAMGRGFSTYAMRKIIRIGFEKLGLLKIYWCVSPKNKRAIKFYNKNDYRRISIDEIGMPQGYSKAQMEEYEWYIAENNV